MKLLITGTAGFIAARTAALLLEQGHQVVGIDNMNAYYDVRLKVYRLRELARQSGGDDKLLAGLDLFQESVMEYLGPDWFRTENFEFYHLDIENKAALRILFNQHQFDAVLNLAARAGVRYSMVNPDVYMTTNANGTLNIMDAMLKSGCKKMVLASTSSLYAGQRMPFSEELPVNTPISPYAASKKAAEVLAYSYHYLYGLDISVVRYFTVFGPAGRPDMSIFRFIKWIDEGTPITLYGDGSQSRDFTYVDDIARGTIASIKNVGYEVINLGGGNNPISINQVIDFLQEKLGKKAEIEYKAFHKADMKETWADITKADRLLNWQPETSPFAGFEKTVEWYKENREWLQLIEI